MKKALPYLFIYAIQGFTKYIVWQELLNSFRERIFYPGISFSFVTKSHSLWDPQFWPYNLHGKMISSVLTVFFLTSQSSLNEKGWCWTMHKPGARGWWKDMMEGRIEAIENSFYSPVLFLFFFLLTFYFFLLNTSLVSPTSSKSRR